jgi:hypothetical protein
LYNCKKNTHALDIVDTRKEKIYLREERKKRGRRIENNNNILIASHSNTIETLTIPDIDRRSRSSRTIGSRKLLNLNNSTHDFTMNNRKTESRKALASSERSDGGSTIGASRITSSIREHRARAETTAIPLNISSSTVSSASSANCIQRLRRRRTRRILAVRCSVDADVVLCLGVCAAEHDGARGDERARDASVAGVGFGRAGLVSVSAQTICRMAF